jgi:hypothetical protein
MEEWLGLAFGLGGRNQWMGEMNHWVGMWIWNRWDGICTYNIHGYLFTPQKDKGRIAKMNIRRKNAPV